MAVHQDLSSPSTYNQEKWIFSANGTDRNNRITEQNTGKWMIFLPLGELDGAWQKIKIATEDGQLGFASKVSTRKPTPFTSAKQAVICVYTYDWEDEEDVMRVRQVLRDLGYTRKLAYKTEEDSKAGMYAVFGHKMYQKCDGYGKFIGPHEPREEHRRFFTPTPYKLLYQDQVKGKAKVKM